MNCNCFDQITKLNRENGLVFKGFRAYLRHEGNQLKEYVGADTVHIDNTRKSGPPGLFKYCPFCGQEKEFPPESTTEELIL